MATYRSISRIAAAGTVCLAAWALVLAAGCGGEAGQKDSPFILVESGDDSDNNGGGNPDDDADTETGNPDGDHPEGKASGAACSSADNCRGDTCLSSSKYPGGYCTTEGCQPGDCTDRGGVCVDRDAGADRCYARCSGDSVCRDGYTCQQTARDGVSVCRPAPDTPPESFARTRQVLGVRCNPQRGRSASQGTIYSFDFSIASQADAFMMVPYVTEGIIRPLSLTTPAGRLDLRRDYRHHNSRLRTAQQGGSLTDVGTFGKVGFDWPIQVPYAPQYSEHAVGGGEYTLELVSTEEKPCLYVLDNRGSTTLDINFYFVGASGRTAADGRTDQDLAAAVDRMRQMYGKVGIELGRIRYRDVPNEIVSRYRRIESSDDVDRLTAYGEPPNRTLDGHLSVDVFLVDDINVGDRATSNVLGMSTGIPGAPGLHGNARNGLVFQTTDLGHDNKHVGHIMAHEIGHYLGLRHTTEYMHGTDRGERADTYFGTTDPIKDTPVCSDIYDKFRSGDPRSCGDYYNLMFPTAPLPSDGDAVRLTDGQGQALRWNPTVR